MFKSLCALLLMMTSTSSVCMASPCAEAYARLATNKLGLDSQIHHAYLASGALYATCLMVSHSSVGCAGLYAVTGMAIQNHVAVVEDHVADSQKIYALYMAIRERRFRSEPVNTVFDNLEVPIHAQAVVVQAVTQLMDSGQLCRDDQPAATYNELMDLLRAVKN